MMLSQYDYKTNRSWDVCVRRGPLVEVQASQLNGVGCVFEIEILACGDIEIDCTRIGSDGEECYLATDSLQKRSLVPDYIDDLVEHAHQAMFGQTSEQR